MKKTIYLSGPMTGKPNLNREAFLQAQKYYQELGFQVENPHDIGDFLDSVSKECGTPKPTEREYLAHDISFLAKCDLVAVLPGFENSKGASFEIAFAAEYGLPVIEAYTNKPLEVNVRYVMKWRYEETEEEELIPEPLEINCHEQEKQRA